MSSNESGWTAAPKRGWKAWKAPQHRADYVPPPPPPVPKSIERIPSSYKAEIGSSAPELVGLFFKNLTSHQKSANFRWRRNHGKCTSCRMGDHMKATCPVWLRIKHEVSMSLRF